MVLALRVGERLVVTAAIVTTLLMLLAMLLLAFATLPLLVTVASAPAAPSAAPFALLTPFARLLLVLVLRRATLLVLRLGLGVFIAAL